MMGLRSRIRRTLIKQMNNDKAALMPIGGMGELMGGHKGYGLATMVEIFSAAFQNGTYLSGLHDTDARWQSAVLAHRPLLSWPLISRHFIPLDEFKHITGNMMRELRGSRKAPDH